MTGRRGKRKEERTTGPEYRKVATRKSSLQPVAAPPLKRPLKCE
jgi:hypothetical protein